MKKAIYSQSSPMAKAPVPLNFKNHCLFCLRPEDPNVVLEIVMRNPKGIQSFQPILNYLTGIDPTLISIKDIKDKDVPIMQNLPPLCWSCYEVSGKLYQLHCQLLQTQYLIQKQIGLVRATVKETQKNYTNKMARLHDKVKFFRTLKESGMPKVQVEAVRKFVDGVHGRIILQDYTKKIAWPQELPAEFVPLPEPTTVAFQGVPPGILIPVGPVQVLPTQVGQSSATSIVSGVSFNQATVSSSVCSNVTQLTQSVIAPIPATRTPTPPRKRRKRISKREARKQAKRKLAKSLRRIISTSSCSSETATRNRTSGNIVIVPTSNFSQFEDEGDDHDVEEVDVKMELDSACDASESSNCQIQGSHEIKEEDFEDEGTEAEVDISGEGVSSKDPLRDDDKNDASDDIIKHRICNEKVPVVPSSGIITGSQLFRKPLKPFEELRSQAISTSSLILPKPPPLSLTHLPKQQGLKTKCTETSSKDNSDDRNLEVLEERSNIYKARKVRSQRCDICNKVLALEDLGIHLREHIGKDGWTCEGCCRIFASKSKLLDHLNGLCKKDPTSRADAYNRHICVVCPILLEFTTEAEYENHVFTSHEKDEKLPQIYECKQCFLKFRTISGLDFHVNQHIRIPRTRGTKLKKTPFRKAHPDMLKHDFKCELCQIALGSEMLKKHLEIKHGVKHAIKCKHCEYYCSQFSTYSLHLSKLHGNVGISCQLCTNEEKFDKISQLRDHYFLTHGIGEEFPCTYCDKTFLSKTSLQNHERSHSELVGYNYKCELCIKSEAQHVGFLSQEKLEMHMKKLHTKNRYKCPKCFCGFICKADLTEHEMKQHQDDPYVCGICCKSFCSSEQFRKHKKAHRNNSRVRIRMPFTCDICSKKFAYRCNLTLHMKSHNKVKPYFTCEHCGNQYKHLFNFKIHLLKHTPEGRPRSFVCEYCSRAFFTQNHLTAHIRIHTDTRPYVCRLCSSSFRQQSTLRYHMKTHMKKPCLTSHGLLTEGDKKK